jgi:hypothetical protein
MTSLRATVLALFASLALVATASAQDTIIQLGGPAARAHIVEAAKPASAQGGRVELPLGRVTIAGSTATVEQGGSLTLRAGRRSLKLTALRVTVGRHSKLTARVGGARRTVATIAAPAARRAVGAAGTYVTEAPLRITAAIARRLAVKPGRLGTIDLEAVAVPQTASDIPGAPPTKTVTGPPTPGGATVATRPAGATTISGGTVRWSPRTSWLNYLASSGDPGSVGVGAPATYDANALTYTFPITGGWFDAATRGAVVDTAGASDFRWTGHALDVSFADWTFDLAGATPKAVITVKRASGAAKQAVGSRQPVGLIRLNGVTPTVSGSTVTWADVPLRISAEGVPLYRGYLYDADQGTFTISATLG